ncbi:SAM-dependent methyltransferase [Pleomorphomonas diazotrophica]|uniref:SAM-dependent methyltransferase n=1 Tax=Pleomorphomonas diazotrophica TaxID=1166257 RepID=A0A1I4V5Q8_9HYPH|nr:class I SAM-dependent methyltransferase [Pleomorphomonas diazotrophica]PKR87453.1 SAM-dependent methyltransferase [Pleomorphomonas diazotrophica]SFM96310.1 Ubiquinone/menaquinone biosynthesis C-methylase UbiE [Pleomorphomonas diazotrophica]
MTTHAARANMNLRDEIQAYWSKRAETFDSQPGHEIFSEEERAAWHALLRRHLGDGAGRAALDLACGTAVVSHLLDDLGFEVTGMDWAEPMLERARAKAAKRGRRIRFYLGDAENTLEPDASYDVITNRHLVWTLVDPLAAFREWHRLLKPGGKLLVVDGDFVNAGPIAKAARALSAWLVRLGLGSSGPVNGPVTGEMAATHQSILSRVYFSEGARADAVVALLKEAGFSRVTLDTDMRAIHRTQRKNFSFLKGLERATQHRYAISAQK